MSISSPCRPRLLILLLAAVSLATPRAEAAVPSLLFLPKAERPKALSLLATADESLSVLAKDRARALASERSYADSARILASVLDSSVGNPDAFAFSLSRAGMGGSSPAGAAEGLADKRRLRWEVSRDLATRRYGHVAKAGFATAEAQENGMVRTGLALSSILSKRVPAIAKKDLTSLVTALEVRVASHPDCPDVAFAALREAAAKLEGPVYRSWLLALTPLLPGPLAADETIANGETPAETDFRAAKEAFVQAYATRMTMKEAVPAAAAAAWYVDGIAGPKDGVDLARVSPQALASLSSFLRNLSAADPVLAAGSLAEDEFLASAFAECVSLSWVAYSRAPSRFALDLGLEPSTVRSALNVAWSATTRERDTVPPAIDRKAVESAEAFVERLEAEADPRKLLIIFAELRRTPAFDAVRLSARYAPVRERVEQAFSAVISTLSSSIEDQAVKAHAPAAESTFHLLMTGSDLFSTVALAAAFERTFEGVPYRTAVPPASLVAALETLSDLIEAGALVVTLPCLVESILPAADELALLGADKGWMGSGEVIAMMVLSRLSGRYGVPDSFFFIPAALSSSYARRLADFGAVAARYVSFADELGGDR